MPTEDFWPSDLDKIDIRTPLSILKEQAAALGGKTGNAVLAEVVSKSETGDFYHRLFLVVPVLDNYRYQLFLAVHDIKLYPVQIRKGNQVYRCPDEAALKTALKDILASDETRGLIAALVAQAKAEST